MIKENGTVSSRDNLFKPNHIAYLRPVIPGGRIAVEADIIRRRAGNPELHVAMLGVERVEGQVKMALELDAVFP